AAGRGRGGRRSSAVRRACAGRPSARAYGQGVPQFAEAGLSRPAALYRICTPADRRRPRRPGLVADAASLARARPLDRVPGADSLEERATAALPADLDVSLSPAARGRRRAGGPVLLHGHGAGGRPRGPRPRRDAPPSEV